MTHEDVVTCQVTISYNTPIGFWDSCFDIFFSAQQKPIKNSAISQPPQRCGQQTLGPGVALTVDYLDWAWGLESWRIIPGLG